MACSHPKCLSLSHKEVGYAFISFCETEQLYSDGVRMPVFLRLHKDSFACEKMIVWWLLCSNLWLADLVPVLAFFFLKVGAWEPALAEKALLHFWLLINMLDVQKKTCQPIRNTRRKICRTVACYLMVVVILLLLFLCLRPTQYGRGHIVFVLSICVSIPKHC